MLYASTALVVSGLLLVAIYLPSSTCVPSENPDWIERTIAKIKTRTGALAQLRGRSRLAVMTFNAAEALGGSLHIVLIVAGAILLAVWGRGPSVSGQTEEQLHRGQWVLCISLTGVLALFAVVRFCLTLRAKGRKGELPRKDSLSRRLIQYSCAYLLAASIGIYLLDLMLRQVWPLLETTRPRLFTIISVPAVLIFFMLTSTFLEGLISGFESEDDREWWARLGAYLLLISAGWLVVTSIVLYGHELLGDIIAKVATAVAGTLGISLPWIAYKSGGPGMTGANKAPETSSKLLGFISKRRLLLPAAALAFLLAVTLLSASFNDFLVLHMERRSYQHPETLGQMLARDVGNIRHFGGQVGRALLYQDLPHWREITEGYQPQPHTSGPYDISWDYGSHAFIGAGWKDKPLVFADFAGAEPSAAKQTNKVLLYYFVLLLFCVTFAYTVSFFVNVNTFSMHGMYRMRLIRAFLGASNSNRHPNVRTDFDPDDNIEMFKVPSGPKAPIHVVNMALNLVGTKVRAWRQRKAESFTVTPLHSGSLQLGYRDTRSYAGVQGITLGTAMAISGAAASPNMGYHSSGLLTFIMALFNVRLGWWLPNPGKAGNYVCRKSNPADSLSKLITEAFGKTEDDDEWVYLSDGGHFDNLGLYEMVLRRCSRIVVVDASADPKFTMEDLGNALRKIEIDFGIPVHLRDEKAEMPMIGLDSVHCATFEICYDAVQPGAGRGELLYLKTSLCGEEPRDVLAYQALNPDFPHEPTSEQFFSESQFESYRKLGVHIVEKIAGDACNGESPRLITLSDFMEKARNSGPKPKPKLPLDVRVRLQNRGDKLRLEF